MLEWGKFEVGVPAIKGFNLNCQPFDTVNHICHIDAALDILDCGEIRPCLVFDESKLNDQRILVSWASPNFWNVGFRYGNIRFAFDFKKLVEGKRAYWIESIAYRMPACRILVTDQNHDGRLTAYDPTAKDGPWWYDAATEQHYFNGNHCLEFMFESVIGMEHLRLVDFVGHHGMFCSVNRYEANRCMERGRSSAQGGAALLARVVATGRSLHKITDSFVKDDGSPTVMLQMAFIQLLMTTKDGVSFKGPVDAEGDEGMALAQAVCSAYSFHQLEPTKVLTSLFCNADAHAAALAIVVGEAVNLDDWLSLLKY